MLSGDRIDEGEPSFTEEEQERWMQSCPLMKKKSAGPFRTLPYRPFLRCYTKQMHTSHKANRRTVDQRQLSVAAACFSRYHRLAKGSHKPTNSIPMLPTILTGSSGKPIRYSSKSQYSTGLTAKIITVRDTIVLPASHPKGQMWAALLQGRARPPPKRPQSLCLTPPYKTRTRQPDSRPCHTWPTFRPSSKSRKEEWTNFPNNMNISTLIMKTYIKYWLMAVTTVMVCTNHVRA